MDKKSEKLKKMLCAVDLDKVRTPSVDLERIRLNADARRRARLTPELLNDEISRAFCEGLKKLIDAFGTEGKENIRIYIEQPEMVYLMDALSVYQLGIEKNLLTDEKKNICRYTVIDSGFYGIGRNASAEIRLEIHRTPKEEYFSNR